jgi:hypothetical protein
MNDLDDLIGTTLHEHTAAAAPDDSLAGRVQATGRRIRRTRAAGVAVLALVAIGGAAWGASALNRLADPPIAATPSPTAPATTPVPTATAAETARPLENTRDVTKLGAPVEHRTTEYLVSDFASPDGSLRCFIGTVGAGCQGDEWAKGVEPSAKICDGEGAVLGPELWVDEPAAWACGTDPHSLPYFNADGGQLAWWDAEFGKKLPGPSDSTGAMAGLPAGSTLIAGDFRCTGTDGGGVECTNTRTGEGFSARLDEVSLQP